MAGQRDRHPALARLGTVAHDRRDADRRPGEGAHHVLEPLDRTEVRDVHDNRFALARRTQPGAQHHVRLSPVLCTVEEVRDYADLALDAEFPDYRRVLRAVGPNALADILGDASASRRSRAMFRQEPPAAQGAHAARTISHDLQHTEDPGPFQPSGSYSTRLYGKSINVLGAPHPHRGREVALAPPGHEAHVTVYTSAESRLSGAVTLGSAKLANRLRPLVAAAAGLNEAADVVTATLTPAAAADS